MTQQQYDILIGQDDDGQVLRFGGTEHVALHARTGSGKTSGFSIPNAFSFPGSMVILDIKGEVFAATAGHRAKTLGQDVYLLDTASIDGRSHRWDPLAVVQRQSVDRFDQISRQAFLLFPEAATGSSGTSNADKFWDPAGRSAFTAVAALLAETPSETLDMSSILRVFGRGDGHDWLAGQIEQRRLTGNPYSQTVVDGVSDYVSGDERQVDGIRKTVSTRLASWYNPIISAATTDSDFDLRDLRRRPMTIYVSVAPGNISRLRPLLRLFFDQLVNLNSDRTPAQDSTIKVPVLVMMDEFARLGRMDTVAEAAQFLRGYGVRLAYVVQNKAQVREIYGKDGAADIFDNLGAEIVFGTNDPDLTKELEERLGDDTVMFTTFSKPRFWSWFNLSKQSAGEHPHRRPLMLDQEVARMSPDEQLIIRPGMRPMKTNRICWYQDRRFTDLVLPPPEIPFLNVNVASDDGSTMVRRRPTKSQPQPEMEEQP
jgi:type IV secretion system protein VirD4